MLRFGTGLSWHPFDGDHAIFWILTPNYLQQRSVVRMWRNKETLFTPIQHTSHVFNADFWKKQIPGCGAFWCKVQAKLRIPKTAVRFFQSKLRSSEFWISWFLGFKLQENGCRDHLLSSTRQYSKHSSSKPVSHIGIKVRLETCIPSSWGLHALNPPPYLGQQVASSINFEFPSTLP